MSANNHPTESVYCYLKVEEEVKKPPRYISKHRPAVIIEHKSNKDPKKTMGLPKLELPSPDKYLKKHSKQFKPPEKSEEIHKSCTCTARKPPVPARTNKPLTGIQTKKVFSQTTNMVPMKPEPSFIDTKKGHKQLLENSGLVPKYIRKKDYGEVPSYLRRRSEAEQKAQEEYEQFVKEQKVIEQISEEEHLATLEGLKKRWDGLHREYQGLPIILDTLSKKKHKIYLEEKMRQLEKDISFLERFKTIYIPLENFQLFSFDL